MDKKQLQITACKVRMGILTGTHSAKAGHPGGSLSAADLFTYLYFQELNVDPWIFILLHREAGRKLYWEKSGSIMSFRNRIIQSLSGITGKMKGRFRKENFYSITEIIIRLISRPLAQL